MQPQTSQSKPTARGPSVAQIDGTLKVIKRFGVDNLPMVEFLKQAPVTEEERELHAAVKRWVDARKDLDATISRLCRVHNIVAVATC